MLKIIRSLFRKRSIASRVFNYIGVNQNNELFYQTDIAEFFHKPLTTINYWITKFKQEGLITKYLELTERGHKLFHYLWNNESKKRLRAHNIQVIFRLDKCPKNFPYCFSKSIYQPLSNKRYKGILTKLREFTVMFYSPRKIVCVLPDIYADTDEEISATIQILIPELRTILEDEFQGIRLGEYELAKIQSMHIALPNSIVAKKYLIRGFTEENQEFAIDNSHSLPEIELTDCSAALRDIMELLKFENKARNLEDE